MALLVVALMVGARGQVYLNLTDSLPRGIYVKSNDVLATGSIVIACVPEWAGRLAKARGYLWNGACPGTVAPIGKSVIAAHGDTVELSLEGLAVNGRRQANTRPLGEDSRRRPIDHFPFGTYVVERGSIWLSSSHHPFSFDSRYFGPVGESLVLERVRPWWTWR